MTPDRSRREMDNVPCLPVRKRSLDVDDMVVSHHSLPNTSFDSISNSKMSVFEYSREISKWDLSCQGMTNVSPLADSPKVLELCSKSFLSLSGNQARASARCLRQSHCCPTPLAGKYISSVENNTSSKASSTGIDKKPFITVRRRPRHSGYHRTLNGSSDHNRRCFLSDRLPTVEEFQRSDFEEDHVRLYSCRSELDGKISRSCGDVRRRGRNPSLRQKKQSYCNEYFDIEGFKTSHGDLSRITSNISEQKIRIKNGVLDQSIFQFDDGDPATESASARCRSFPSDSTPRAARITSSIAQSSCFASPPLHPTPRPSSARARNLSCEIDVVEPSNDVDYTRRWSTRAASDEPVMSSKSSSVPKLPTRKRSTDSSSNLTNATWRN
jgi:hypothetical protein